MIDNEMIKNAYRKLKSYSYYDNSALHLKKQIAEFESNNNFEDSLNRLTSFLDSYLEHSEDDNEDFQQYFNDLLKRIEVLIVPKSFNSNSSNDAILNFFAEDQYEVSKVNYLFQGPVELHIICVLWILVFGKQIEKSYINYNYASALHSEKYINLQDNSHKLFKPYFQQYQNWRDEGIKIAKENYSNKRGVAILTLDIKEFYYSIDFDFSELKKNIEVNKQNEKRLFLTELIEKIVITYNEKFKQLFYGDLNKCTMPLGLLVSPILANWYLRKFDEEIVFKNQPLYYGRYVDDIMIVMSEASYIPVFKNSKSINITQDFIKHNFIENIQILNDKSETEQNSVEKNLEYYSIKNNNNLHIQESKVKLYILKPEGTEALIEKFLNNIRKNSSEFRFLPDEERVTREFYDDAYSMIYGDTTNKLRSIEEFKGNKYGASKYLAKIIYSSKFWKDDRKKIDEITRQIKGFFEGRYSLEFYSLWEKIFVFFIINNKIKEIGDFYQHVTKNIEDIVITDDCPYISNKKIAKESLKTFLYEYLQIALGLGISLNYNVLYKSKRLSKSNTEQLDHLARVFRKSNLLRHSYLLIPLINYSRCADEEDNLLVRNLMCTEYDKHGNCYNCNSLNECLIDIDKKKVQFSPRPIHYHECQLYEINNALFKFEMTSEKSDLSKYISQSNKNYIEFNRFNSKSKDHFPHIKHDENIDYKDVKINYIKLPFVNQKTKFKIGVVNTKVAIQDITDSYLKEPNLSRDRLTRLFRILNYIEKEECDLVILPEVSVPHSWLQLLADFSRKHQKAIIFGLEHVIFNNCALNLLVTILPFELDSYKHSFVKVRLKNHYSPEERRELRGYRYYIPEFQVKEYDLFNWRGVKFSSFNCFELADIRHRSLFRSKVDFLTASEYNKDINYFSNIVESVTRDIHCYFIQVNSSDFGDSRITKPSKTAEKDILKLKGGINDSILIGEIDINVLREFQLKEYELQKYDSKFKPTPPNFEINEVNNRIRGF